jgi:hypothetical protein
MSPRAIAVLLIVSAVPAARAAVTVEAYYRLGDADPGAVAGNLADNPTVDSTTNRLDLTRRGTPTYSSDVPANFPTAAAAAADKLSVFFNNNPLSAGPGPIANDGFSRPVPVSLPSYNWGIEAWVKPAAANIPDPTAAGPDYSLIAYNGRYFSSSAWGTASGLGLFQKGSNYVVRIGTAEKVLAPVTPGKWTHLVFLRYAAANTFYVDGTLQTDTSAAAQTMPVFSDGYLAIGSFPTGLLTPTGATAFDVATNGFYGNVDEVRFFTFNPTGPGAFDPSADLLYAAPAPEPATTTLAATALLPLATRRRQRRQGRSHGTAAERKAR